MHSSIHTRKPRIAFSRCVRAIMDCITQCCPRCSLDLLPRVRPGLAFQTNANYQAAAPAYQAAAPAYQAAMPNYQVASNYQVAANYQAAPGYSSGPLLGYQQYGLNQVSYP